LIFHQGDQAAQGETVPGEEFFDDVAHTVWVTKALGGRNKNKKTHFPR
jgi:hypothetical protein